MIGFKRSSTLFKPGFPDGISDPFDFRPIHYSGLSQQHYVTSHIHTDPLMSAQTGSQPDALLPNLLEIKLAGSCFWVPRTAFASRGVAGLKGSNAPLTPGRTDGRTEARRPGQQGRSAGRCFPHSNPHRHANVAGFIFRSNHFSLFL